MQFFLVSSYFLISPPFFQALKRLKTVCDAGLISVLDFKTNPLRIFAAHEMGVIDPAMGTKMTVQFNLFGGTGTEDGSSGASFAAVCKSQGPMTCIPFR